MYDRDHARTFYDAYDTWEWRRLEATAYGRLQAIIHTDFLQRHLTPGVRVLDAGSGPGRFTIALARLGGRVTALDLSRRQLEIVRQRLDEAGIRNAVAGLLHADIVGLPFGDNAFDLTICFGGPLSYVGERQHEAANELLRVTRPGGVILVSVMSRLGAVANTVRSAMNPVRLGPAGWDFPRVLRDGKLSGMFSSKVNMAHPAMHLYTAAELPLLFTGCAVLEIAGSNVTTFEGAAGFEQVAADADAWATIVELERALNHEPGLLDSGGHIIAALRR